MNLTCILRVWSGGERMAEKRIYAGYYKRYDGTVIYVVTTARDADTGEETVIWTPDANSLRRHPSIFHHEQRVVLWLC